MLVLSTGSHLAVSNRLSKARAGGNGCQGHGRREVQAPDVLRAFLLSVCPRVPGEGSSVVSTQFTGRGWVGLFRVA